MNKGIFKKTVWGFHLDFYQHVNNARYLEFFEEARWEFMRPLKESGILEEKGWYTIVVHIEISYKAQLGLGDEIEIHTSIPTQGKKSLTFHQQIFKSENTLAAEAFVKFVVFDTKAQKSLYIDEEIKELFGL